jgi:hypothetical protein
MSVDFAGYNPICTLRCFPEVDCLHSLGPSVRSLIETSIPRESFEASVVAEVAAIHDRLIRSQHKASAGAPNFGRNVRLVQFVAL